MKQNERHEFAPPPTGGLGRSFMVAVFAHLLLLAALTWGIQWKKESKTMTASAELWSAVPQEAAPAANSPELPAPTPPEPAPPEPVKPTPPPPPLPIKPEPEPKIEPKPVPPPSRVAADIALKKEKEKKEQEKKAAELEKKKKAEREAKALEDKEREKKKLADAEKRKQAELLAKEKAKAKAKEEAKEEAKEAQRAETRRVENLKRMQGMAGASGDENAKGTALKSSGPSASYAGRVIARIKPNITFSGDRSANPVAMVDVRTSPDGTIVGSKLFKSSGNKAWDDAVLRAIEKTEMLPRDTDGQVPSELRITFSAKD